MSGLTIVNYSHPLTDSQRQEIARLTGWAIERVLDIPAQFDTEAPFIEQGEALIAATPLDARAWQSAPLLVNLPSLAPIAGVVLALILGRRGSLPSMLRLKPVRDGGVTAFAVAEIIDLDDLRNRARAHRFGAG